VTVNAGVIDAMRLAVGTDHVMTAGDLSAYELDWRKRYRGRALAVVRPASTAEVAAVVRACAAHGVGLVAQGATRGSWAGRCRTTRAHRYC
jgi:FAD/FMN-containing dehydrogenase